MFFKINKIKIVVRLFIECSKHAQNNYRAAVKGIDCRPPELDRTKKRTQTQTQKIDCPQFSIVWMRGKIISD